ncbi:hypothetical protein [Paraflavitalea pollutisoli]|nr:hypothetical protein [Paraflavitalea sp. H1-2-19X]
MVLVAGKLECPHKAFEIVDFTMAIGGNCLEEGMQVFYIQSQTFLIRPKS